MRERGLHGLLLAAFRFFRRARLRAPQLPAPGRVGLAEAAVERSDALRPPPELEALAREAA